MSSNATGDTQPDPAVVADKPAAVDVAGLTVAAGEPGAADAADAVEEPVAGAVEGPAEVAVEDPLGEVPAPRDGAALDADDETEDAAEDAAEDPADDADDDEAGDETGLDGDDADYEYTDVDGFEPVGEFRPGRRWPRILLAVGFVLAGAGIVVGAIAIVGSLTHGFKKPVRVTYKKSAVFSLKTGDCLDPQGQSYTLIPCDSPHDAEVFATFQLPGTKWPGTSAAATAASDGCTTRLPGYLNPQLAISLASTYVYPDSIAWQSGTHTVICEVRAASGQLTGSVRGASATAG